MLTRVFFEEGYGCRTKFFKALPLGNLKKYVGSYTTFIRIRIFRAVERDDIIDAIVAVRVGNFI